LNRAPRIGDKGAPVPVFAKGGTMKLIAYLLGIILIAVAVVYFITPADHLPNFLPGYDPALARAHIKHGILSGVLGLVLLAIGWFMGRR
jgi:hypothetical protein